MAKSPIERPEWNRSARMQDAFNRADDTRKSRMDSWQASIERAEKRRLEKLKAQQEAALQAQRASLQGQRDKQQQKYEAENANRQANNALGAANADFQNQQRLNDQQRRAVGQRDKRINQFETDENRRKNRDLRERDQRQFGYTMAENEQQFGNQLERDYRQQGYSLDRDRLQGDQTLQRDVLQGGIQADRDQRLNMFNVDQDTRQQQNILERESLQNQFQSERDARLNIFDTQRDVRRQQFEQQSLWQREAADIAAKWQQDVQIAKDAGLDFSPQQREEMKQLEKAFRRNVLNGDLSDDMKQRAMVEHQRQMASFVPEERVQGFEDLLKQSRGFDPETGMWFMMNRDPRGGVSFEPLANDSGQQQGQQEKAQMQLQQKQAESLSKKQHERLAAFQSVYDQVETMLDANDRPKFDTPEKVMKETMRRFFPREKAYQADGLPPLGQLLNPDEVPQPTGQQQPTQPANPWRAQLEQRQAQSSGGMADSLKARSGDDMATMSPGQSRQATKQPQIISTKPLPKEVTTRITELTGNDQLAKIREKHSSNSENDLFMRQAADIVINAMITNDTSDPDLEESVQLLRTAGFTLNVGK